VEHSWFQGDLQLVTWVEMQQMKVGWNALTVSWESSLAHLNTANCEI